MAWALLNKRERRRSWLVLVISLIAALSTSVMVASIMPFLSVLAEPGRIHDSRLLQGAYQLSGAQDDQDFIFLLGVVSIGIILFANVVQVLRVHVVMRFATMRAHTISFRLLSSYLRQPYSFFLSRHSGDMGTQILAESQQLVIRFFIPMVELLSAVFTIATLLALLLYLDPIVSIGSFLFFGIIYGSTLFLTRNRIRKLGELRAMANGARYKIADEALGGIKELKLLGRERAYLDRYHVPSLQMGKSMAQVSIMQRTPQYVMQASVFAGLILLCLVLLGGDGAANMAEILPTIGLIALTGQRLIPELSRLFQSLNNLTYGIPVVRAVHRDMVGLAGGQTLPKSLPAPIGLKREISFDRVTYRFENGGKAGIEDLSLSVRAGERIGIVGTTGAGKSTLANILLGLLHPTEGRFRIDGTEITPDNVRSWQRSIGYVPQEIFLTDASVKENIAFGLLPDEIDQARVEQAARIAQLHDFIVTELDNGYDTSVGERGVRLSGGQRQRIGIARALYDDADLIMLDEATSALDTVTETEVMRAIEGLSGDKTIVMIAHRLSTLRGCDRILVLDHGHVSAFAPWDELLQTSPIFRSLAEGIDSNASPEGK